jgi:hypothetical protein
MSVIPEASSRVWRSPNGKLVVVIAALLMTAVADVYGGLMGQMVASVVVWILALGLMRATASDWRLALWACMIWATFGEIVLSLVWGLYSYRLGNIPFFVPPGHVLLFYLGLVLAPRVPRLLVIGVGLCAFGYAVFAWATGTDTLSIALILLFSLCMIRQKDRQLYALMFVIALLVELYGTWIGSWVWHGDVPWISLTAANPPIAAGVFYCVLDALVGLTVQRLTKKLPARRKAGAKTILNSNPMNST